MYIGANNLTRPGWPFRDDPTKTPGNSSLPPSKAFQRNRPQPDQRHKRGPKVGRGGVTRPWAELDVTLELRVERCCRCGQRLDPTAQPPKERRPVGDLPPLRGEAVGCLPTGLSAPPALGPSERAVVACRDAFPPISETPPNTRLHLTPLCCAMRRR